MTEEQTALASRAVACEGWRWMPGMRASLSSGLVVRLAEHDEGSLWHAILAGGATCTVDMRYPSYTVAPDLSDPATVGCLLALVREAWGGKCGYMHNSGYQWLWIVRPLKGMPAVRGAGASEAESLVAALEAAP